MSLIVEVGGISKTLGSAVILDGVNFSLEKGKVYGLLGLNGVGKSTLLKILSGLLLKDSGSYLLDGDEFTHLDPIFRRKIGFLPEKIPIFKGISVWNYLFFWSEVVGLPSKEAVVQIEYCIEKLNLVNQVDSSVDILSKGCLQRVGVATAILGYPQLLLLDEPMSGLDPSQIVALRSFLRSLSKERHITIVISSHRLDEISRFCDEVLILSQKKIFLQGEPGKLMIQKLGTFQIDFESCDQADLMKKIINKQYPHMLVELIETTSVLISSMGIQPVSAEDIKSLLQSFWSCNGTGLLGFSSKTNSLQDVFLNTVF